MVRKILIGLLIFGSFFASAEGYATTYNASSWSQFKTYVELTAKDGDTVTLAAGTYSASKVTVPAGKNLILQGSGSNTHVDVNSNYAIDLNGTETRITGFYFDLTAEIAIRASGSEWRIDNCTFDGRDSGTKANEAIKVTYSGLTYPEYEHGGLIDNNYLLDSRVVIYGASRSSSAAGSSFHSAPLGLGTSTAVYFEDNTFLHSGEGYAGNAIDSNDSSAYVVRFNKMTKTGEGGAFIHAHSAGDGGSYRGAKKWEVYGNDITHGPYETMFLRSGTGVVFGNDITDNGGSVQARVLDARMFDSGGPIGKCDGNATSCARYDGCENSYGYVCRDQFGTGGDKYAYDGSLPFPEQFKTPAYFWNNTSTGDTFNVNIDPQGTNEQYNIVKNRDFYEDNDNGVRTGRLANIPNTCTAGQAYWATDQGNWNQSTEGMIGYGFGNGVLYKCTTTNNWKLYYTPYTYPHPLRNKSAGSSLLPSPPTGLRVVQ